jgi:hypothetical protein
MSAEAIAMRRIIAERGYYLNPLLAGEPVPTLTEYERTVDLIKLARNGIPIANREKGLREPARPPQPPRHGPNGSGRSSAYKPHTTADLREKQIRKNQQRNEARAREKAIQDLNRPPAPQPEPKPEPPPKPPKEPRAPKEKSELAKRRAAIRAMSPEERKEHRKAMERARTIRRRDAQRTPEHVEKLQKWRALTPEEKREHRRAQCAAASLRYEERLRTDPTAAEARNERKRDRQRAASTASGAESRPYRWKENQTQLVAQIKQRNRAAARAYSAKKYGAPGEKPLPTARELREEAIRANEIERGKR